MLGISEVQDHVWAKEIVECVLILESNLYRQEFSIWKIKHTQKYYLIITTFSIIDVDEILGYLRLCELSYINKKCPSHLSGDLRLKFSAVTSKDGLITLAH